MMTCCNSRERTAEQFETLFAAADPRLKLVNIHRVPGSPLGIMEVRFSEKATKS